MIRLIQDKRPHHGYVDVWVNPSDVMSINDLTSDDNNRSAITLRDGSHYYVTDYASVVAERINEALKAKAAP